MSSGLHLSLNGLVSLEILIDNKVRALQCFTFVDVIVEPNDEDLQSSTRALGVYSLRSLSEHLAPLVNRIDPDRPATSRATPTKDLLDCVSPPVELLNQLVEEETRKEGRVHATVYRYVHCPIPQLPNFVIKHGTYFIGL